MNEESQPKPLRSRITRTKAQLIIDMSAMELELEQEKAKNVEFGKDITELRGQLNKARLEVTGLKTKEDILSSECATLRTQVEGLSSGRGQVTEDLEILVAHYEVLVQHLKRALHFIITRPAFRSQRIIVVRAKQEFDRVLNFEESHLLSDQVNSYVESFEADEQRSH